MVFFVCSVCPVCPVCSVCSVCPVCSLCVFCVCSVCSVCPVCSLVLQDISSVYQIFADEVLGSGQFGIVYGGEEESIRHINPYHSDTD